MSVLEGERRRQYLEALGVEVWVRRDLPEPQAVPPLAAVPVVGPQVAMPPVPRPAPRPEAWDALAAEVAACERCPLHEGRLNTVFGVGNREADWLVIGEAPGAEEDKRGEPFVGRAGQLLNSMLGALGLKRETVYIANILKCRPPGNRDPRPEEVVACSSYLARQIELIGPKIVLAVGRIAAQNLLEVTTPIGKLRGQVHTLGPQRIPLVVTYHPAYLLRTPSEKRKAWQDLLLARRVLEGRS
ncbi:MAG: uracil-DNA glycosylase [Gammaproteobacteria bacterium]|nr:uracil-DNA glycosylase [Gammaproteobacteria bacterium]MBI5617903.1 uracil-DNA glycosylase [Gammaproteobacteria bacterium]